MLPGASEGFKLLPEPPGYEPIRTPARKLMATPTPFGGTPMYQIPEEDRQANFECLLVVAACCACCQSQRSQGCLPAC